MDGKRKRSVPGKRVTELNLDSLFLNLMTGWKREFEPIGTGGTLSTKQTNTSFATLSYCCAHLCSLFSLQACLKQCRGVW
jgi:hypothetical protein